jgi:hypothetical protein
MRAEGDRPLISQYPKLHILDPENYAGVRFYETIIRAAILRAATRKELEFPTAMEEERRMIKLAGIIRESSPDKFNFSFEIILSAALHKAPNIRMDRPLTELVRDRGWMEVFEFFANAL